MVDRNRIVIVGAGPVGLVTAIRLADAIPALAPQLRGHRRGFCRADATSNAIPLGVLRGLSRLRRPDPRDLLAQRALGMPQVIGLLHVQPMLRAVADEPA